jgi:transglutaminase-like putative cysteine protease
VPDFQTDPRAKAYPFVYDADEMPDLMEIARGYPDPNGEIDQWVRRFLLPGRPTPTGKLLMTLTYAIKEGFTYTRRSEHGTQDPVGTVRIGRGSCRDFALLMMEAVRSLGFAARFVSGYLYVPSRDLFGEGGGHVGGGSTHAWCQVYLPGAGWVEFDPTNGIIGNRDLIRVAVARDPSQAIPLSGTYAGRREDELGMTVQVNVTRDGDAGDSRGSGT